MNIFKKTIAVSSALLIVGGAATVSFAGLLSSGSASAQISGNELIFMTTTKFGVAPLNLNWGPGTTQSGPGCSVFLSHASEILSVAQSDETSTVLVGSAVGVGKVKFKPLAIAKQIDTGTAPLKSFLAVGKPFNVQLSYFHSVGVNPIDCSKPDMIINLMQVTALNDSLQVDEGGGGNESLTLNYGLESVRTASFSQGNVWSWDNNGYCFDAVKNLACNAAALPILP